MGAEAYNAPAMRRESVAEFTLKAVLVGIVLGVLFGAANAYLGLRVGLTISASIPAAVMTVAVFRALGRQGTILEANLSQTIGSASTSLASGTIFTIPALYLWGMTPSYFQVVALCFLGGVLGLTAMIPLRRLLIVQADAELPYPEGRACADVLRATSAGAPGSRWIFWGMGVGAAVKLALAVLHLFPDMASVALPFLLKAEIALELAPALFGVGFILGYRGSAVLVAGSILSSLGLIPLLAWMGSGMSTPLYPETAKLLSDMSADDIWRKYVRYIGAGAVATAGVLTLTRTLPAMVGSLTSVVRGLRAGAVERAQGGGETDRDLPAGFVLAGVTLVIVAAALFPLVFGPGLDPVQRAVCAAGAGVFGVLFVTVAARIVGIVGVTSQPTSGITLVTLLGLAAVFAAAGWTDPASRAAVLTVGTLVAIAASKAGDISQDLKTGYLVGATPAKQQLGQLIGASFACWAVAGTVVLLGSTPGTFGSQQFPAPQATLMKTIIEGVLAGSMPWTLVGTGAGVALSAMLCGVSGLAFAIGVYLPLSSMLPIYVGGCVRALSLRGAPAGETVGSDPGVLAASGLVAGEALTGLGVAAASAAWPALRDRAPLLAGAGGAGATLAAAALVCAFLWLAARSAHEGLGR
jgi:putative OPT family oligopeptide transporter